MAVQPRMAVKGQAMLQTQVVRREETTPDTVTLWLALPGTHRAPAPYLPGQFITLALPGKRGPVYRSYSLSSDGRLDVPWEITIKRQRAGLASQYLFERAQFGAFLTATLPRGTFILPRPIVAGMPLIFVAVGVGIAPIYGMLRAMRQLPPQQRSLVQLHYAAPQSAPLLYGRELAALALDARWLAQWNYSTSRGAHLTPEAVLERSGALAAAAHWYICGAEDLKTRFQAALERRGIAPEHIHSEIFAGNEERPTSRTTPLSLSERGATVARVRLAENGALLDVRAKETLLQALERRGYTPDYSCRTGVCGICRLRLLAGQVRHSEASGLTPDERAEGYILACTAYPTGDITVAGAASKDGAGGGRAARRGTMVALRLGMAATAAAVFGGAWVLTNHPPTKAASAPNFSPPVNSTPGGSGVSTQPLPLGPHSRSGVS